MAITIRLEHYELTLGALIGAQRHIRALVRGAKNRRYDGNEWHNHIEAALGEMVVAKALCLYWDGFAPYRPDEVDLPHLIQVRTRSKHEYDLIVREADVDSHRYVLVTGQAPEYRIRGWILAGDAKDPKYRGNPGGHGECYLVPAGELRDLDDLAAILTEELAEGIRAPSA